MKKTNKNRSLEMRIIQLENTVKKLTVKKKAVHISAAEIEAYKKVRKAMDPYACIVNACDSCTLSICAALPPGKPGSVKRPAGFEDIGS